MKKILSLFLSLVMLLSITAGVDLSAYADDYNATPISTNGNWCEGYISDTNTTAFYKITIPSDGTVTFKFMYFLEYFQYTIYNYDSTQRIDGLGVYTGGSESSPRTIMKECALSRGIYYIKLSNAYGSKGKYKISAQFKAFKNNEKEPNDYENAMNLTADKTITGALTIQDDVDWYKITIPTKCTVTVSFKYYMDSVVYGLYNNDLSTEIDGYGILTGGSETSPKGSERSYELSKGIYYIKFCQGNGKYQLYFNYKIPVSKPTKIKVSSRNTTNLKLAWNKVGGVSGYQLQRKSGNSWKTVATTTSTSCTVKNLKAGTAYAFRVRAYKTINGTKYYSGWRTLTTPTNPATVSFSSLKAGKKKFTAKWKKTACTGYQLQYSTSSKFKGAKTVTVSKNSTTSKTVSKLKGKKKYYVRVRAYKTVNGTKYYGAWSKAKTVKTK